MRANLDLLLKENDDDQSYEHVTGDRSRSGVRNANICRLFQASTVASADSNRPRRARGHSADEHAAAGHGDADHEHEHGGQALTEESVKTPESFAAGVARLKELHQEINI